MKIDWLGHASVRVETGEIAIYIDPYQIASRTKADIILITHDHFDHLSVGDIERVLGVDTVVVSPPGCSAPGERVFLKVGDKATIKGVLIEAVAAYNVDKPFHPRSAGGVGYLVTSEGETLYHAGDTDLIEEMNELNPTVALLPVSGTYVMTPEEAAEAAKRLAPELAIPIHYGAGVAGTEEDAKRFAELLGSEDIAVKILEKTV
jgi:L-ascorbate metabolism protein UlaG (beta-lactamase superfamily)